MEREIDVQVTCICPVCKFSFSVNTSMVIDIDPDDYEDDGLDDEDWENIGDGIAAPLRLGVSGGVRITATKWAEGGCRHDWK